MKTASFKDLFIRDQATIRQAMRQMDDVGKKVLFVVDENECLMGSLTDGDLRRHIIKNGGLEGKVEKVFNPNPRFFGEEYDVAEVKRLMITHWLDGIPVISADRKIVDVLFWSDLFADQTNEAKKKIDVPVVIMAGGKGTRLDPFTKVLPKPLIPIHGKPIIEIIIEKFCAHQVGHFYISLQHKSRMVKSYFSEMDTPYKLHYIEENEPLGTAGSLRLLDSSLSGPFFVTNCDIIIESDYHDMLQYHKDNANDVTLIGSYRQYVIPYGICEISKDGLLKEIREKETYEFWVSTGFYILEPKVIKQIPPGQPFSMPELINKVKQHGGRVGVFPISEKSWIDIGQWDEYRRAITTLKA